MRSLTPSVHDLGCLRLWRDDLAELVAMAESLGDAEIQIETEASLGRFTSKTRRVLIDDFETELPRLGQQLNYFQIKATRARAEEVPDELLTVYLSKKRSMVEATDPDPDTRGIISDIQSFAKERSRIPAWMYIKAKGPLRWGRVGLYLVVVLAFIATASGSAIADSVRHGHPLSENINNIVAGTIAVLFAVFILTAVISVRTILLTGTRSQAPTFWQRHGADIIINLVVGIALFLLGRITANVHF